MQDDRNRYQGQINLNEHLAPERAMAKWSDTLKSAAQARQHHRGSQLWVPVEKVYPEAERVLSECIADSTLTPERALNLAVLFDQTLEDYQAHADEDDYSSVEWALYFKAWTHGFSTLVRKSQGYDKSDGTAATHQKMDDELAKRSLKHIDYWLRNSSPVDHIQTYLAFPALSLLAGTVENGLYPSQLKDPHTRMVKADRLGEAISAFESHARKERGGDYAYEPRRGWLPLGEQLGYALASTAEGAELLVMLSSRLNRQCDQERCRFMPIHPFDGSLVTLSLVQALFRSASRTRPTLLSMPDTKGRVFIENFKEAVEWMLEQYPLGHEGLDRAEANLALMVQEAPTSMAHFLLKKIKPSEKMNRLRAALESIAIESVTQPAHGASGLSQGRL